MLLLNLSDVTPSVAAVTPGRSLATAESLCTVIPEIKQSNISLRREAR